MFGAKIRVEWDGFGVTMGPIVVADLPVVSRGFSSAKVHRYTRVIYRSNTEEDEREWYEKTRKDLLTIHWGLYPDGADGVQGVCGLHGLDVFGSCTPGLIIWNPELWGKGIASRVHIGLLYAAAFMLGRKTLKTEIREPNVPSIRAAVRVGYIISGREIRTILVEGRYIDSLHLTWINPDYVGILFPEGIPQEYEDSVEKARLALQKAREVVELP